MSVRSGKGLQLRAAAEYALVDTFYACETVLTMGLGANCLRLYVASTVDNPGNVEFYVKHRAGDNKEWHDYCGAGDAPAIWGKLIFTDKDQFKSFEFDGLNLYPGEQIKVHFRASANAGVGGAQLSIEGISFDSAVTSIDVETGYVRADNASRVEEVNPLDTRVDPVSLVDTTNITQGTHEYPNDEGKLMTPYKGLSLSGKIIAPVGKTLTLTVHASNDKDGPTADFRDVTKSFVDDNLGTSGHASYTVTADTLIFAISKEVFNYHRYFVQVVSDDDGPANTLIVNERRIAL